MSLSYITHKGKRILFVDYTHCKTVDEMVKVLDDVKKEYEKSPGNILAINDFNGTFGSSEFLNAAKKHKQLFDGKTHRSAVLGITGIKKILLNGYNAFITNKQMPFDTKEEALEYLVK